MESSGTLLTHPGFFKQRMQSHHFQYFNVTSQRKKKRNPILCIWTERCVSRSFSVPVQRWPWGQMAADSCYLVRKHEGLVAKQNAACACVRLGVLCSVGFCCGGGLFVDLRGARESSVQSQQRLGVLTFPLVFVFQCAGFHHRLGPECRKTHMIAMTAAEAPTSLGSPCFFL